jgi:tetratricopeptide (TPR) repeat protein
MRLIAFALAITLSGTSTDERGMDMLRDWIAAVDVHSAGEPDTALAKITAWTYEDVERLRPFLEAFVDAPLRGNKARQTRRSLIAKRDLSAIREAAQSRVAGLDTFRRRAAVFHTDAALLADAPAISVRPASGYGPPGRRVVVKSFDGQFEQFDYANPHWELAMDMLDALPAPPRDPIVAQWYAAIGTHLVQIRQLADALRHYDRARELVPTDPHVRYGEARLHEVLAAPRIQNYVNVAAQAGQGRPIGVDSSRTHWRKAEQLFQAALAGDSSLVQARLRLGRIMIQQGRHDEGLGLVKQARAELQDSTLRYYAELFSGDAELALGRADEARQSYERAVQLFPDAQSARLGLAAALNAAGQRESAISAVLPTLTKRSEGRAGDDPWWAYYDGNAAETAALLARLRAPFTARP